MLTVHFVDKDHLLITFSVRRLMKREVDPPPGDDDRTIAAVLVELPSGKVLARDEWRVHDRSQYLWSLGQGRFLLRVRDRLTVFAPMEAGGADGTFREIPFLRVERRIVAILVSPDGDLLTVETTRRPVAVTDEAGGGTGSRGDSTQPDAAPVQINFYRLTSTGASADELLAVSAGAIVTRAAITLPLTTSGYLDELEGGRDRWLFNFNTHTGKVSELSGFDTTCVPRATFVGHGEFVAFGCRGSPDRQDLAGFNLKGEEMWQQNFFDTHISPTFSFAPAAGRFALSRTIVGGAIDPDFPLVASQVTAQEVRVYQSYDGKQLFRTECSPVERAGQNFALSPDGLRLAVVHDAMVRHAATKDSEAYTDRATAVEVYTLPGLTDKDKAAVKEAEALAPEDTGARIDFSLRRVSAPAAPEAAGGAEAAGAGAGSPAAGAASVSGSGSASESAGKARPSGEPDAPVSTENDAGVRTGAETVGAAGAEGDPEPEVPRKPPTLYGPDETPAKPPQ